MIRVAYIRKSSDGYAARIADIPWDSLSFVNGAYKITGESETVVSSASCTLSTASEKLSGFIARHGGVHLNDSGAVSDAIEDDRQSPKKIRRRAAAELSEAELDLELIGLGFLQSQIGIMEFNAKRKIYSRGLTPDAVFRPDGKIRGRQTTLPKEVRGYRLLIGHDHWPLGLNSVPRKFNAGVTPDQQEVEREAQKWIAAGFNAAVIPLKRHHKSRQKVAHTLHLGDPHNPICCLIPGCGWVGDNLGSHLVKHGFTIPQYREMFSYHGEVFTGKAVDSLAAAHSKTRKSHDLRVGMYVAIIESVTDAQLYMVAKIENSFVVIDSMTNTDVLVLQFEEFFARTKPVAQWARRVRKKYVLEEEE